ncbi:(Fe-S)-binding protein [Microscilla marina]|uniref:4Fe-4S binding domain protein n=1 Tax=Microscilla marina ATCC 23134 TaxID=313606 RepID=A1ZJL7_MICM2|nr:(Fe-S)-binding protein [Microscilla marina]EAY29320.1 4Fe-4S binding domain protein [Microscilla marina ATCC 23134]
MKFLPQVAFLIALGVTAYLIYRRVSRISANIKLGRSLDRTDNPSTRWKTMLRIAFGQQKMFDKPLVGILHFLVYAGFVLINIEVLEIIIDGVTGTHRIFAGVLGGFYTVLISFFEFLAVGVLLACVIFLIRRNLLKVPRFGSPEMKGWPTLDATVILVVEITLMAAILLMNAADTVLQAKGAAHYTQTGAFLFSQMLTPVLEGLSINALVVIERVGWWFHILGIFAFAVYVTYSKHLHIALAFPNTYFSNLQPKGYMDNMESVTNEVQLALGLKEDDGNMPEIDRFGAKDINDLTWKNLMDAYSCTECGRCTSNCPANITGKKLSPRKVMMDTRDRMEEIGEYIAKGGELEKALAEGHGLYSDERISKQELMACTTCNACTDACPINIDPLSIILQMRRYIALEEADTPQSWNSMFTNIENNMAPWQFSPTDRFNWAENLND